MAAHSCLVYFRRTRLVKGCSYLERKRMDWVAQSRWNQQACSVKTLLAKYISHTPHGLHKKLLILLQLASFAALSFSHLFPVPFCHLNEGEQNASRILRAHHKFHSRFTASLATSSTLFFCSFVGWEPHSKPAQHWKENKTLLPITTKAKSQSVSALILCIQRYSKC